MRPRLICLLTFALFSIHAGILRADDDPNDGKLVDAGKEKIVIFADTTTTDGHYAFAWTIRPKHAKKPVDWSNYDPDKLEDWLQPYDVANDYEFDTYAPVNGVLDLRSKQFTVMPCAYPYLPHNVHDEFGVTWSDERSGTRYALVTNQLKFDTENIWLVTTDATGVHPLELTAAARKAAGEFVRKHSPKTYRLYQFTFTPATAKDDASKPLPDLFKAGTVTVHFEADIPRKDTAPFYEGTFLVALANGTISHLTETKQ